MEGPRIGRIAIVVAIVAGLLTGCGSQQTSSAPVSIVTAPTVTTGLDTDGQNACYLFGKFLKDDPTTMTEQEIHDRLNGIRQPSEYSSDKVLGRNAVRMVRDQLATGVAAAFYADAVRFGNECKANAPTG